jgi:tRNA(fMet)-specific endonuclease VapC
MIYLLDTSICIYYLNRSHPSVVDRVAAEGPVHLAISALTLAELYFGADRSSRPAANRARLLVFSDELTVVPFDEPCSEQFGQLKTVLWKAGQTTSDFDIGIAATAIAPCRPTAGSSCFDAICDDPAATDLIRHPRLQTLAR